MDKEALISCFEDTVKLSHAGKLAEDTARAAGAGKIYFEGFSAPAKEERSENAFVEVETLPSFQAAKKYLTYGKVAVLNFANPQNPGGGVKDGAMAQEECLCRSSNLYPCLNTKDIADEFYGYHRKNKNHLFSDRLIYTPGVTVFKTDETYPELLPDHEWFHVDIITCAAPYQEKGRYVNPEFLLRLFISRITNIFEAACDNDVDVLVLGAFGCGAFHNPPRIVAQAFSQVINTGNYLRKFKRIIFAIQPTGEICPNVLEFVVQFDLLSAKDRGDTYLLPTPPEYRFIKVPKLFFVTDGGQYAHFRAWQKENRYFGKQFSIIGDSVSTFEGYNPKGYKVFYDKCTGLKTGVLDAADTWWDKVICFFGGELLVNNAWSGSRVTLLPGKNYEDRFPSACSPERTANLHCGDVMPDVIIINMGVNDWANGVKPRYDGLGTAKEYYASFDSAYESMLLQLKKNYPTSEIWCCTLSETFIPHRWDIQFPHRYAGVHIKEYNQLICKLAQENQCRVVDLYKYDLPYASVDGTHPTADGMNRIACLVISEVCGREIEETFPAFPVRRPLDEEGYIDPAPGRTGDLYTDEIELYKESAGQKLTAKGEVIKAGDGEDCSLVLEHPYASGHLATFYRVGGGWYIQKEQHHARMYLNGSVLELGKKYKLYNGDMLSCGYEKYCFFKSRVLPKAPQSVPQSVPMPELPVSNGMIGKIIAGKYKILSCISDGGMSKVYLATDITSFKQIAVKMIAKTGHADLHAYLRKQNRILMGLAHPGIPSIIAMEEDDQYIYIIREYVCGEAMDALIKRQGAISVGMAINWAVALCDVLGYLHTRTPALIYRDMKPANILVLSGGTQLKLIDFGIMREYKPPKKEDTAFLGTKGYAAPEQYGGAGQTDARTDIFALGMTLHHMVTGCSPLDTPYAPIRQFNPNLPERLEKIIARCVEPDANKRFQTAEELKKALLGEGPIYPEKPAWKKLFTKS